MRPGSVVWADLTRRGVHLWNDDNDIVCRCLEGDMLLVIATREGAWRAHEEEPILMLFVLGRSGLGWINSDWVERVML